MTSYLRSIFTRRTVDSSRNEAHQRALERIDEIIHRIEQHNSPYIESSALEDFQIECHELELPSNKILCMPTYFQWPREPLPPPHPTDQETQRSLKTIKWKCSEEIRGWRQMLPCPITIAEGLGSDIEWMFRAWRRDVPPDADGLVPSLMRMAQWRSVGFSPKIIADEFDLPIWQSLNWNPRDAWVSKTGKPHIMLSIVSRFEPRESLQLAEALIIAAVIVSRLRDPSYATHMVIPVMMISYLGGRHARILQAYNSGTGLVVHKSRVYSFFGLPEAMMNFELFMQAMASTVVGDTTSSSNITQPTLSKRKSGKREPDRCECGAGGLVT